MRLETQAQVISRSHEEPQEGAWAGGVRSDRIHRQAEVTGEMGLGGGGGCAWVEQSREPLSRSRPSLALVPRFISTHCMPASMLSHFSHVQLFETPRTIAHQAPLSTGFSRQDYWSGLPFPPLGDLPHPGMKPMSHVSSALAERFFTTSATWEEALQALCGSNPESPNKVHH